MTRRLIDRYDGIDGIVGVEAWRQGFEAWYASLTRYQPGERGQVPVRNDDLQDLGLQWLLRIRQTPRRVSQSNRTFVSHRQIDDCPAIKIAALVQRCRLDFWLDIFDFDPARNRQSRMLEHELGRPLDERERATVVAAVIEMALLNSTHLIAAVTRNSWGSMWIPYEYGRVKAFGALNATNVASWYDPNTIPITALPEYLALAVICRSEIDVMDWCLQNGGFPVVAAHRTVDLTDCRSVGAAGVPCDPVGRKACPKCNHLPQLVCRDLSGSPKQFFASL